MIKKRSIISLILITILTALACLLNFLLPSSNENDTFQDLTKQIFQEQVASNTLTLHYTLENPSAYGVRSQEVSLGNFPTSASEVCAAAKNQLAALDSIHYQKLDSKNKLTYKILEDSLNQTLKGAPYLLYMEPLSPLTGVQCQLPILLSEFQLNSKEDVDLYLELLSCVPNYIDSLIKFEQEKAKAGLFMASYTLYDIKKEIHSFLMLGADNYLYSSFENRISHLKKLSKEDQETSIEKNKKYLEKYVFPSFKKLSEELGKLDGTGINLDGLCNLPKGKEYYQYLVQQETGSNRSIAELETLTKAQIQEDLLAMEDALAKEGEIPLPSFSLQDADPTAILSELKGKIQNHFPAIPDTKTEVKEVQEEMQEYLSPAFYLVPEIDNTSPQTIYINPGHLPEDLTLYTTLAHEGYPGHLYQHVYFDSTNPDPIRSLLDYGGYTEGWATYTEMISYYFADMPKDQAILLQHNSSIMLGLYALADIGIHNNGWTLVDTVAFFREYGITDTTAIESIFDLIVADPANYLKYYVGYLEFLNLKKDAMNLWGDEFSQMRFHKEVLDAGPMPFYLLREVLF
ncbi:MAG: DUF885 domain-containing protein [Lachnospiraceae bacterium]|nr:DUF885 domain-containing protein [Lachnospiraceae bacterium]